MGRLAGGEYRLQGYALFLGHQCLPTIKGISFVSLAIGFIAHQLGLSAIKELAGWILLGYPWYFVCFCCLLGTASVMSARSSRPRANTEVLQVQRFEFVRRAVLRLFWLLSVGFASCSLTQREKLCHTSHIHWRKLLSETCALSLT